MKKLFCIVILGSVLGLHAQRTYVTVYTRNGLTDTLNLLRESFFEKQKGRDTTLVEILNTRVVSGTDTFQIFMPSERAVALFFIHDYKMLFADVVEKIDFHCFDIPRDVKAKKPVYFYYLSPFVSFPWIDPDAVKKLGEEKTEIKEDIDQSSLTRSEKDFLLLYLESILAYNDLERFDWDTMGSRSDAFVAGTADSIQKDYVNNILNMKMETRKFGAGFAFSTGMNFLSGNITHYFKTPISFGGQLEAGYKGFMLKMDLSESFPRHVRDTFSYRGVLLSKDSAGAFVFRNLSMAYNIIDNKEFRFSPFAGVCLPGISVSNKVSNTYEPAVNVGFDLDWKFAEIKSYRSYSEIINNRFSNAYWFVRLQVGYTQLKNSDSRFNGNMVYLKFAVGTFSNRAKRLKREVSIQ